MSEDEQELLVWGVSVDLQSLDQRLQEMTSPAVQPVGKAFLANIGRVRGQLALPQRMAEFAGALLPNLALLHQLLEALLPLTQRAQPGLSPPAQEGAERMRQNVETIRTAFRLDSLDISPQEFGTRFITHLSSELQEGLKAILSSATTGSWTAFECLATDLWVDLLNAHPRLLAQKAIEAAVPEGQD
jgi:hypothetical protein